MPVKMELKGAEEAITEMRIAELKKCFAIFCSEIAANVVTKVFPIYSDCIKLKMPARRAYMQAAIHTYADLLKEQADAYFGAIGE